MLVIGGGIIGLEMGSVYARMGTKVAVIEFMDRLIPTMDLSLGKEMQRILRKLGIKFHLNHAVQQAVASDDKVVVTAKNKKGDEVSFEGEYCLVAVGRKPFTDSLGLDKIGLQTDERGRLPVNDQLQTTVSRSLWDW
jgi:dihydrolipoamide dehydrogenase